LSTTTAPTTDSIDALVASSIAVIAAGQAPSGAYVASPTFSQYGYSWLRDGSYIALGMDAVGETASAERFHDWTAGVIESQAARIAELLEAIEAGIPPAELAMLPARYRLDGVQEDPSAADWPNFQLDGYGTWLFALHSHLGGVLDERYRPAVELAASYIDASWMLPCYDYWEEFGDRQHTSTLAALAAGLRAASRLLDRPDYDRTADAIMTFVRESCVSDGSFVKGPHDDRVDASLLSLRTPFGLVAADDPVLLRTAERIRTELASPTGGIRRYVGDTYFGGSPWLLLTAWLGWHDRLHGRVDGAVSAVAWVRSRASDAGTLAEQDVREPQAPEMVAEWTERWGAAADPLLWSHGKYLLLEFGGPVAAWT
jgi:isomaltose glucohydrolase